MVEWWPEYVCPICGYSTTVTNICRRCEIWMFPTGHEEHSELDKDRNLLVDRRKMTNDSELYNQAMLASHFARTECEERGIQIPDWAWFGERKI